jgi:hypothetical protein
MVAPVYGASDRYGRDLRVVGRERPNASYQSITSDMRDTASGTRIWGVQDCVVRRFGQSGASSGRCSLSSRVVERLRKYWLQNS